MWIVMVMVLLFADDLGARDDDDDHDDHDNHNDDDDDANDHSLC
jgi:hypothetical protein